MADLTGFNPKDFPEGSRGRDPIPAGTYPAVITETTQRTSTAGNDYLELAMEIIEGPHKGRRLWDRLNLWHPKEAASEIAKRRLASACRALGITSPRDSAELHDKPLGVVVAIKLRSDNGEKTNEVTGYAALAPQTRKVTADDIRDGVANALAGKKSRPLPAAAAAAVGGDDDIPF